MRPDTAPNAAEENNPANDQRSLDIGESGQFAPGGYYNQHGVAESKRLDLDEYTATRPADDKGKQIRRKTDIVDKKIPLHTREYAAVMSTGGKGITF